VKLKKINWKIIKKINQVNLDQPVKPATRSWDYDSLIENKLKKTWSPIKRKGKKNKKANQPNLQLDHKIGIILWKVNKKIWISILTNLFEIVVGIAVQNVFRLEIYQNDVFLFLKNYFWDQHIKTIWKHKKIFLTMFPSIL